MQLISFKKLNIVTDILCLIASFLQDPTDNMIQFVDPSKLFKKLDH